MDSDDLLSILGGLVKKERVKKSSGGMEGDTEIEID